MVRKTKRTTKKRAKGIRGDGTKIGTPRPVDIHVGARVRLRRSLLGMSQEKLGDAIGLTFQQIQKYERGANRIGASRLFELSRILDVPITFFFDDMPEEIRNAGRGLTQQPTGVARKTFDDNQLARRETLELVRAYYRIPSPKARKRIFELTKTMASEFEGHAPPALDC